MIKLLSFFLYLMFIGVCVLNSCNASKNETTKNENSVSIDVESCYIPDSDTTNNIIKVKNQAQNKLLIIEEVSNDLHLGKKIVVCDLIKQKKIYENYIEGDIHWYGNDSIKIVPYVGIVEKPSLNQEDNKNNDIYIPLTNEKRN